jgi:hypothetical protein
MHSSSGVRQGDSLSSFLFSLGVHDNYLASIAGLSRVTATAIMDDFTLVGEASEVFTAIDRLKLSLAGIGLDLNPDKCHILWPYDHGDRPVPLYLTSACIDRSFPEPLTDFIPLLGGAIGLNEHAIQHWLLSKLRTKVMVFFNKLKYNLNRLPSQITYHLLRSSGVMKLNYWCRIFSPALLLPVAQEFDQQVFDLLVSCTKLVPPNNDSVAQNIAHLVALPVRLGGLGLRRISDILKACFVSSVTHAVPIITPFHTSRIRLDDHIESCLDWIAAITEHSTYQQNFMPTSVARYWSHFSSVDPQPHLQRLVTALYDLFVLKQLDECLPISHKARLVSCQNSSANHWLNVLPSVKEFMLTNAQFSVSVRLRLGLHPIDNHQSLPNHCVCFSKANLHNDHTHFEVCPIYRKQATYLRHNCIVLALTNLIRNELHLPVAVEPNIYDHLRPDAEILLPSGALLTDISVTNPAADSYVVAASKKRLSAASTRENQKISKYSPLIADGRRFVPYVIESTGACGEKAKKLLNIVGAFSNDCKAFVSKALKVINFELQRGNCLMFDRAAVVARSRYNRRMVNFARHGINMASDELNNRNLAAAIA